MQQKAQKKAKRTKRTKKGKKDKTNQKKAKRTKKAIQGLGFRVQGIRARSAEAPLPGPYTSNPCYALQKTLTRHDNLHCMYATATFVSATRPVLFFVLTYYLQNKIHAIYVFFVGRSQIMYKKTIHVIYIFFFCWQITCENYLPILTYFLPMCDNIGR